MRLHRQPFTQTLYAAVIGYTAVCCTGLHTTLPPPMHTSALWQPMPSPNPPVEIEPQKDGLPEDYSADISTDNSPKNASNTARDGKQNTGAQGTTGPSVPSVLDLNTDEDIEIHTTPASIVADTMDSDPDIENVYDEEGVEDEKDDQNDIDSYVDVMEETRLDENEVLFGVISISRS